MNATIIDRSTAAERLMSTVLRDGRPLADEYPLVFGPDAPGRLVGVEADGELRATCAILRRDALVDGQRLPLGLIGSVVTQDGHRRQGLGTSALEAAHAALAEEGAAFSFLWADDPAFYEARGYVPAGAEFDFMLYPELTAFLPPVDGVRAYAEADAEALHALYEAHPERIDRSADETRRLLRVPGMRVLVHETEGRVDGYACVGRGEDLERVVHEWGGENEALLACVHAHLADLDDDDEGHLFLMAPPTARGVASFFDITRTPGAVGVLAMARVLSREAALEVLRPLLPATVSGRVEGEQVVLTGPAGELALGDTELVFLTMAPKRNREVVEAVEQGLGVELPRLPLMPFVWGLDGI